MKIDIPFKDMFKEVMLSGQKTMTSRSKWYGSVGDTFQIFGRTFEITDQFTMLLKDVAIDFYREEGFESEAEFKDFWVTIHPRRKYEPNRIICGHVFKLAIALDD